MVAELAGWPARDHADALLIFIRLTGWLAPLARWPTSKGAKPLILRQEEVAVLRQQNPEPKLD